MAYLRRSDNLTRSQVLENLKFIVNSEYFRRYEAFGENANISTAHIIVKGIGGVSDNETGSHFTLADVAGCLESILDDLEKKPEIRIDSFRFTLYTPAKAKKRMGITKRAAEEHEMGIVVDVTPASSDECAYNFVIFNPGLRESARASAGAYQRWYRRVDREVAKLPHALQSYSTGPMG